MKIQIKTDPALGKDEVVVLCHPDNTEIHHLKNLMEEMNGRQGVPGCL